MSETREIQQCTGDKIYGNDEREREMGGEDDDCLALYPSTIYVFL